MTIVSIGNIGGLHKTENGQSQSHTAEGIIADNGSKTTLSKSALQAYEHKDRIRFHSLMSFHRFLRFFRASNSVPAKASFAPCEYL